MLEPVPAMSPTDREAPGPAPIELAASAAMVSLRTKTGPDARGAEVGAPRVDGHGLAREPRPGRREPGGEHGDLFAVGRGALAEARGEGAPYLAEVGRRERQPEVLQR